MVDSGSEILSYFSNRIQAAKEQQLTELDLSVPSGTHENDKLDHIPDEVFDQFLWDTSPVLLARLYMI